MAKSRYPVTQAIRYLRSKQIDFTPHRYEYAEHGGAEQAAAALNLPAYRVVKTLVMETEDRELFIMLMHGGQTVSTKQLARVMGKKKVMSADPNKAQRCTGYQVGGISPFGVRTALPVYVQATILELEQIYINGGKRGFLVAIDPHALTRHLNAIAVDVIVDDQ